MRALTLAFVLLCGSGYAADDYDSAASAHIAQLEKHGLVPGGTWEKWTVNDFTWWFYTTEVVRDDGTKMLTHWKFCISNDGWAKRTATYNGIDADKEISHVELTALKTELKKHSELKTEALKK